MISQLRNFFTNNSSNIELGYVKLIYPPLSISKNDLDIISELLSVWCPYNENHSNCFWTINIKFASYSKLVEQSRFTTLILKHTTLVPLTQIALLVAKYTAILREDALVYTLHSSAISLGAKSIVFVGDHFSGKTTLALLSSKYKNVKVTSLNYSLILASNPYNIIGGTKTVTVRSSIFDVLGENSNKSLESNADYFNLQKFKMDFELDFSSQYDELKVEAFLFLVPWGKELKISPMSQKDLLINLYNRFSYFNNLSIVFEEHDLISNFRNYDLDIKRYNLIKSTIQQTHGYYITGSPHEILNYCINKFF